MRTSHSCEGLTNIDLNQIESKVESVDKMDFWDWKEEQKWNLFCDICLLEIDDTHLYVYIISSSSVFVQKTGTET